MTAKRKRTRTPPGRPTLSPTGEVMKVRHVRFPDDEWAKCLALGGSEWMREQVRNAVLPQKSTKEKTR